MYRDLDLVRDVQKYQTGANTHFVNSTLYRYYNANSEKYKHLYKPGELEKIEERLRKFVAMKGIPPKGFVFV